ncbi:MAG TPA: hypothetical protein VIV12_02015 [Streptosporangiaceae bacterium]
MEASDFVGVLGWKALLVRDAQYLSPMFPRVAWTPGVMAAVCQGKRFGFDGEESRCLACPGEHANYGCGFHAAWHVSGVASITGDWTSVTLVVLLEGLGRVVVHELGWRSELARVVAPVARITQIGMGPDQERAAAPALAADYFGVPVMAQAEAERLVGDSRKRWDS